LHSCWEYHLFLCCCFCFYLIVYVQNSLWKSFAKGDKKKYKKKEKGRETPALGLMAQSAEAQSFPPPRTLFPLSPHSAHSRSQAQHAHSPAQARSTPSSFLSLFR
jgi:hypothetical protein